MRDWTLVRTALLFPIPAAWFVAYVAIRYNWALRNEPTLSGLASFIGCLGSGAFALTLTRTFHLTLPTPVLWAAAYAAGATTTAVLYYLLEAFTPD